MLVIIYYLCKVHLFFLKENKYIIIIQNFLRAQLLLQILPVPLANKVFKMLFYFNIINNTKGINSLVGLQRIALYLTIRSKMY